MEINKNEQADRRSITVFLLAATLLFALALGGIYGAATVIPQNRAKKIRSALDRGDAAVAAVLLKRCADTPEWEELRCSCTYLQSEQLQEAGDYAEASEGFASLSGYLDSAERAKECRYRQAEELAAAGDYAGAAEGFTALSGYADSLDRVDECRYNEARSLEDTEPMAAFILFDSLGGYSDAEERKTDLAIRETGISEAGEALNTYRGLSPEETARREELAAMRDALPKGILDVGFFHTVGLKSDGAVVATGDNSFGQCDVENWTQITQIACGANHTVGVKSDGTVVAAGDNSFGQCDVDDWSNIVQVACCDHASFGLKKDGTVVYTGYRTDYYRKVSGWSGITSLAGGSYALGALRADGSALLSHISAQSDELKGLTDLAVNTAFAMGIGKDGRVISPFFAFTDRSDVLALSCSGAGAAALCADGSVELLWFHPAGRPDASSCRNAVAIALGGTHFVWVNSDGSVGAAGSNEKGECAVEDWQLF